MHKKTLQEFIREAQLIHSAKYDYKKSVYVDNKHKIIIICPIHGEFTQTPDSHLRGCGCPSCGKISRNSKNTKISTTDLQTINETFGFNYDFTRFVYNGYDEPSIVICPFHGEFLQTYHRLKYGHGCQLCGNKHHQSEKYVLQILRQNFSNVEYQKHFKWLHNKKPMSLDFFLPYYNIAIEYQGRQHFCEHSLYSDDFDNTIARDLLKIQLCKQHSIQLLHLTFEQKYVPKDFKLYNLFFNVNDIINVIKNKMV